MAPRKGLIAAGFCLMAVNRVAGLVMPFTAKPLMDKVLSPHGNPALLPKMIALVFWRHAGAGHHVVRTHPTALEGRPAADRGVAQQGAEACRAAVGFLLR
jgi:hypothetical protein